ncbi:uncharacterized protein E0L32_009017 [Thyridium curvatum]|uniref:Calponin-homology (CH) domain-containing protein n=1 Tax=Thyridium curvatum TaxID=1093900 RepID=A0A507AT00_9PEZI|nr:uncharacterized protein E0L32_009017 [Thyridium curvatum]TPX09826.1 hypothetical protein E0L32_009017 [Thyridium curvatum]
MASVSSLDKDLRKMRLDKYTPAAANEARAWIENILGDRLAPGDLLEALKDGVALCQLVNLAVPPPGVRFKQSAMPFVQMENISMFLRACQEPPLNLQQHDMFLTVDLYESKDPAQVLQCLGAFSRAAHAANPSAFPSAIGPKSGNRNSVLSPQSTGSATPVMSPRGRGISNASNGSSVYGNRTVLTPTKTGDSSSGRWSPTKSPTSVSSWSKREHEGATAPAWNIAQYGYMGGASQGNLGISFGGRRQITSAGPTVPSLAEKERLRKEKAAEEERQRQQMEEEEARRRAEIEAEEQRAREEEERRWEEETRRAREEGKRRAEEERRRWEEEERQWKLTEEKRRQEEQEAEARLAEERSRSRSKSDARLRGQFLSQYQAEEKEEKYSSRVKELEAELEKARQREQEYERERQERHTRPADPKTRARSRSRPNMPAKQPSRTDSWSRNEREFLQTQWNDQQQQQQAPEPVGPKSPPQQVRSPRPLPTPTAAPTPPPQMIKTHRTGESLPQPPQVKKHHTGSRPLPDPTAYASPPPAAASSKPSRSDNGRFAGSSPGPGPGVSSPPNPAAARSSPFAVPSSASSPNMSRTDRFLASNPAPQAQAPPPTYSRELGATAERDAEDRRRAQSQQKTRAGGWAGKSLLEREMEMERQRQREWEEAQRETAAAAVPPNKQDGGAGGERWDVNQWTGYTGGDSQNRGGQGIGAGRRQIVGPRPLPGSRSGGF